MTVQAILDWLDSFAPFATQEPYDNAGLLIGNPAAEITRVLFAMDATLPIVQEARELGVQLLITHHPLMFGGIRKIRYDEPEGAVIAALAVANMHLIAAHTNFDQVAGGTSDTLAHAIGLNQSASTLDNPYIRTGDLPKPESARQLLQQMNNALDAHIRLYGDPDAMVSRISVGAGAAGEDYPLAVAAGAQAYAVGEIKHHELLAARAMGLLVYEIGHHSSEQPGLAALYNRFLSDAKLAGWPVAAHLTTIQPLPCITV